MPDGDQVVCGLCPHRCRLAEGETGACGVRRVTGGALVTEAHGRVAVARPAPIERSFLYHFLPGARVYAYAAAGCNLRCRFCQNWMVSQAPKLDEPALPHRELSPEALVAEAEAAGCRAVVATYTEPTIFLEYARDVATAARRRGLSVAWKSNGFIEPGPLAEVVGLLDAVNVDLKAFDEQVHRRLTGAPLAPVLATLRALRSAGVWLEVTTLVIPTVNDTEAELSALARFVRDELGADTPWHLTRFHPDWELRDLPPTPKPTLHAAREQALALGLRHVYTDAEPAGRGWDTACSGCGAVVLRRAQYELAESGLADGRCPACDAPLPGRFR